MEIDTLENRHIWILKYINMLTYIYTIKNNDVL